MTPKGLYLTSSKTSTARSSFRGAAFLVCLLLSLSFVAGIFGDSLHSATPTVAAAGPEEDRLKGAAGDQGITGDQEGYEKMLTELQAGEGMGEGVTFLDIARRLLTLSYMNDTELGVPAGGMTNPKKNCDLNHPHRGTLLYHNCDVPNITTEFFQFVASSQPSGPAGATVENAKVLFGFGIPSTIPGNKEVPIDPAARTVKYTGLELFGYNSLKFTSYLGEWDNIKVMTTARALANFGFMDAVHLGVASIVNGVVSGVNLGASRAVDKLKQGDVIGAVFGLFSGIVEGTASGVLKTILDTSDLNVFNTYAWYRVGYGPTLYRGRELSQVEIQANMMLKLQAMLEANAPQKAALPEDFVSVKEGPQPKPVEAISKCVAHVVRKDKDGNPVVDDSGKEVRDEKEIGPGTAPGGLSEGDCSAIASGDPYYDSNPTWEEEGNQKRELLSAWIASHSNETSIGSKYGISCTLGTDEGNRQENLASFYSCWTSAWDSNSARVLADQKSKENQDWYDKKMSSEEVRKWMADPANNFNAPWNRFVCTDERGRDIREEGGVIPVTAYKPDGTVDSRCKALRPPIQDGFYGNGYGPGVTVPVDTRHVKQVGAGLALGTNLGNMGLSGAKLVTQVSVSLIDLSFSPILAKLGLTDKLVTIIEAFRDSIYFPFVILIVAISALQVLFSAGKSRDYNKGIVTLLLMCLIFMVSVFVLAKPRGVVNLVEDIPSQIETAVLGTIFSVGGGDDNLCSATQGEAAALTGLEGEVLPFSPRAATRTLECEVWRAFAYSPWLAGQWGTTYDRLTAAGSGQGSPMQNLNGALVGDAGVVMGGGVTEHNWSLYQLSVLSAGTSTSNAPDATTGLVPRDFYRLVDLQAGPDNGSRSDGRFFGHWSGSEDNSRYAVGFLAPTVALAGLVTIFTYCIVKIEITLVMTMMILLLPMMLLLGLHPTFGKMQLKKYLGTLVALSIQRILLVLLLGVFLRVLTAVSLSSTDYFLSSLLAMVVCFLFMMYRKEILAMVKTDAGKAFGGVFAEDVLDDHGRGRLKEMTPKSLKNFGSIANATAVGAVGGFIGGTLNSGLGEGLKASRESIAATTRRARNRQRRSGQLGQLSKVLDSAKSGARASEKVMERDIAEREAKLDSVREEMEEEILNARNAALEAKGLEPLVVERDEFGNRRRVKGKLVDPLMDPNSKLTNEMLKKIQALEAEAKELESGGTLKYQKDFIKANPKFAKADKESTQYLEALQAYASKRQVHDAALAKRRKAEAASYRQTLVAMHSYENTYGDLKKHQEELRSGKLEAKREKQIRGYYAMLRREAFDPSEEQLKEWDAQEEQEVKEMLELVEQERQEEASRPELLDLSSSERLRVGMDRLNHHLGEAKKDLGEAVGGVGRAAYTASRLPEAGRAVGAAASAAIEYVKDDFNLPERKAKDPTMEEVTGEMREARRQRAAEKEEQKQEALSRQQEREERRRRRVQEGLDGDADTRDWSEDYRDEDIDHSDDHHYDSDYYDYDEGGDD